jgi:ABC-type transporter Mla subunit MlaD
VAEKLDREVKIGAMVFLISFLGIAVYMAAGDVEFREPFRIYVDFEHAGGLPTGAPVRIAGMPAGYVETIQFLGGEWDEALGRNVYARATLRIDDAMAPMIGEGAQPIITSQSLMSQPYIEIENAVPPGPPVASGTILLGWQPVRMDQLMRSVYRNLTQLERLAQAGNRFFTENDIAAFVADAADGIAVIDGTVVENRGGIRRLLEDLDSSLSADRESWNEMFEELESDTAALGRLLRGLNTDIGNGSEIRRALQDIESASHAAAEGAPEALDDLAEMLASARDAMAETDNALSEAFDDAAAITADWLVTSEEIAEITSDLSAGRGGFGELVRDDTMFEDLRELFRELALRPWRLIWKE